MATFAQRMIGAARLDRDIYEEVEADRDATGQAVGVVTLVAVATGLGVGAGFRGLLAGTVTSLLVWVLWAALIYWTGTKLLPEPATSADWGQVARTVGFAGSPGVLRVIGIVPVVGELVFFVTAIWMLITTVMAIRQALDYTSWGRAIGVCLIGWIVQVVAFRLLLGALRTV
jgi:hypothetical protein